MAYMHANDKWQMTIEDGHRSIYFFYAAAFKILSQIGPKFGLKNILELIAGRRPAAGST